MDFFMAFGLGVAFGATVVLLTTVPAQPRYDKDKQQQTDE